MSLIDFILFISLIKVLGEFEFELGSLVHFFFLFIKLFIVIQDYGRWTLYRKRV